MPFIRLLFLALLALTLTGCVEHKIDKGVVVDKSRTPAYTSFIYNDEFIIIPIVHHAVYRLSVRDNGITETFNVDEHKYSSLCIGDSVHIERQPYKSETFRLKL